MATPAHLGRIRPGHYVTFRVFNQKADCWAIHHMQVTKVLDDTVIGDYLAQRHLKQQTVEVPHGDLVCNFGETPPEGIAFGFDYRHDILVTTKEHPQVGPVNFFYHPKKETGKALWSSYDNVANWLTKHKLGLLLQAPIEHDVVNRKAKYAGMFQASKRLDKTPCRITMNVESADSWSVNSMDYVVAHEYAHAIDYLLLTMFPKHRAKWLALYISTVEPLDIDAGVSKTLRKTLLQAESVKTWLSGVDEDHKDDAKAVMRYFSSIRGLSTRDLDSLLSCDLAATIDELWPATEGASVRRNLKPVISEYATKNVKETIAEALAFYSVKAKLPSKVTTLTEAALDLAAKGCKQIASQGGWITTSTEESS